MMRVNSEEYHEESEDINEESSSNEQPLFDVDIYNIVNTAHYNDDAHQRRQRIIDIAGGLGTPICGVYWDKGHANGPEVHILTTTAIIVIVNHRTKRLITTKLSRPGQIIQLYGRPDLLNGGRTLKSGDVPNYVMEKALFYVKNGYNL